VAGCGPDLSADVRAIAPGFYDTSTDLTSCRLLADAPESSRRTALDCDRPFELDAWPRSVILS